MSKADIAIVLLLLVGAFQGYQSGFLMGLLTLVAIVLGIFGGFKLMGEGMLLLQREFNADKDVLPYLSFLLIFLLIVIGVSLLGRLVKTTLDKTFLGKVDQLFGALLGAFKWLFLMSVLLWIMDSLNYSLKEEWIEGSRVYPYTVDVAAQLAGWVSGFLPFFEEIFKQY